MTKKMFWAIVIVFTILGFGGDISYGFSNKKIKEISQQRLEKYSDRMLVILLEEMKRLGYDFSKKSPMKPKIVIGDEMTRQDFDRVAGKYKDISYSQKHLLAAYSDETNTIILPGQSYLDTLFHEMVHFVQVQYRQDFDYYAVMEPEAVEFQEWFKKAYMKQEEDGVNPCVWTD